MSSDDIEPYEQIRLPVTDDDADYAALRFEEQKQLKVADAGVAAEVEALIQTYELDDRPAYKLILAMANSLQRDQFLES